MFNMRFWESWDSSRLVMWLLSQKRIFSCFLDFKNSSKFDLVFWEQTFIFYAWNFMSNYISYPNTFWTDIFMFAVWLRHFSLWYIWIALLKSVEEIALRIFDVRDEIVKIISYWIFVLVDSILRIIGCFKIFFCFTLRPRTFQEGYHKGFINSIFDHNFIKNVYYFCPVIWTAAFSTSPNEMNSLVMESIFFWSKNIFSNHKGICL